MLETILLLAVVGYALLRSDSVSGGGTQASQKAREENNPFSHDGIFSPRDAGLTPFRASVREEEETAAGAGAGSGSGASGGGGSSAPSYVLTAIDVGTA